MKSNLNQQLKDYLRRHPEIAAMTTPQPTLPESLHIGAYIITFLPEYPDAQFQGKVALHNTMTHEGGTFDANAVGLAVTDALDTFFMENF